MKTSAVISFSLCVDWNKIRTDQRITQDMPNMLTWNLLKNLSFFFNNKYRLIYRIFAEIAKTITKKHGLVYTSGRNSIEKYTKDIRSKNVPNSIFRNLIIIKYHLPILRHFGKRQPFLKFLFGRVLRLCKSGLNMTDCRVWV